MKALWISMWHALLLLSISLLVKSEKRCEEVPKPTELCRGDNNDCELQSRLEKWRNQRAETIKTLKDVRDKLDTVHISANYGKGAGNGVQIVGTVASIVGSFMELAGLPSFKSVMKISDLVYYSGSLVDGASSIVESLGSAKYLQDAENILKEDKNLSDTLGDWLEAWNSADEKIQEIFGFGEASEKWFQLANVLQEFSRIQSITRDFKKTVDYIKSGEYSTYIATEMRPDQFLKLCNYIEKNPQIPTGIRIGLIGFNRVPAFVKSYWKLLGREISDKMATIPQKYKAPTTNTVAKYTVLRSVDVAVNFLSLLDVAKVIKEGKSKYSNSLKEIIDILELELKNIEGSQSMLS